MWDGFAVDVNCNSGRFVLPIVSEDDVLPGVGFEFGFSDHLEGIRLPLVDDVSADFSAFHPEVKSAV